MIIDNSLILDPSGTALVGSTTTASTNVLDLLAVRDLGVGNYDDLELIVTLTTNLSIGGTYQIKLQTSTDNSTYTDLLLSPTIATGATAGTELVRFLLPEGIKRYLRLQHILSSTVSTGSIIAYLVLDHQANTGIYNAGYSTQYI